MLVLRLLNAKKQMRSHNFELFSFAALRLLVLLRTQWSVGVSPCRGRCLIVSLSSPIGGGAADSE